MCRGDSLAFFLGLTKRANRQVVVNSGVRLPPPPKKQELFVKESAKGHSFREKNKYKMKIYIYLAIQNPKSFFDSV